MRFFYFVLDLLRATLYNVTRSKEVNQLAQSSRADYFKNRRSKFKSFTVEVERDKMERFEEKLRILETTKAEWLNKKIDEEIGK